MTEPGQSEPGLVGCYNPSPGRSLSLRHCLAILTATLFKNLGIKRKEQVTRSTATVGYHAPRLQYARNDPHFDVKNMHASMIQLFLSIDTNFTFHKVIYDRSLHEN